LVDAWLGGVTVTLLLVGVPVASGVPSGRPVTGSSRSIAIVRSSSPVKCTVPSAKAVKWILPLVTVVH
jgi:hypothetical protein